MLKKIKCFIIYLQKCYEYFHEKYGISKFLIKKILKEGVPYKLNGNCKTQEKVRLIEGLELFYVLF